MTQGCTLQAQTAQVQHPGDIHSQPSKCRVPVGGWGAGYCAPLSHVRWALQYMGDGGSGLAGVHQSCQGFGQALYVCETTPVGHTALP
jgi:hypothetical protein